MEIAITVPIEGKELKYVITIKKEPERFKLLIRLTLGVQELKIGEKIWTRTELENLPQSYESTIEETIKAVCNHWEKKFEAERKHSAGRSDVSTYTV